MNYTSTEKPEGYQEQQQHHHQSQLQPQQQQLQPQAYMPSPHLSSRSSGSTIEEEIENALSQLQVASDVVPMNHSEAFKSSNNHNSNEIKVENWDVERVADWLKSVGLDSVSTNFIGKKKLMKKKKVSISYIKYHILFFYTQKKIKRSQVISCWISILKR